MRIFNMWRVNNVKFLMKMLKIYNKLNNHLMCALELKVS